MVRSHTIETIEKHTHHTLFRKKSITTTNLATRQPTRRDVASWTPSYRWWVKVISLGQEMQLVTLADYTQAWQSLTWEVCPGISDTVLWVFVNVIFASRVVLSHKDPMVCCHHFNWASAVPSVVAIVNGMIVILLYHAHSNNNGRGQKPLKPGYPKVCKVQAELAMCRRFVNPSRSQVLTNEWNHFQRSHLAWVGGSSFGCVWCVWKGWP